MKRLNVGIIGAGRIGRVHAENLAFRIPESRVTMIADLRREAAVAAANSFSIPKVADSADEILASDDVDAVIICSSTDTHSNLIALAAESGKHVFCEKPVDHSLEKIDIALGAVERAGVKLHGRLQPPFDHNFMPRARARAGRRRRHAAAAAHHQPRPGPSPGRVRRVSGGIFLDMTIHDFDMARYLTGDEVEELYTTADAMIDPEIGRAGDVDTALIVLRFRNGAIGTIDNSRKAVYGYDQRVEILGSAGSISTSNCYPNEAVVSTATEIRRDLPLNFFMDRYTESFVEELRAFVNAVLNDAPPPVTGHDGRVPVVMALAARKSFDEHRPVRLTEVDVALPVTN
jgi:myo-inositol 2-dehydrogenase / D-chiro-inositol 1-dehydrogenase